MSPAFDIADRPFARHNGYPHADIVDLEPIDIVVHLLDVEPIVDTNSSKIPWF